MMPAIVPFISLFVLFLISRTFSSSWRQSLLTATVIWGLLLTVITEALSVFEGFSYMAILSSWLLSGAVLAILYVRLRRGRRANWDSIPSMASLPFSLLLPIGFIVSLTGLIALVAPPNNYDSMTYHLGRVVHWIQNHDVRPYPTNIDRQLYMPPWAEFAISHFQILSGGDRLANAVQWLSMLGSLVGVSLIAKQLGGNRDCQVLASLVAVCLPMGILQASSTQNDYVVTFWLVCFAYYVFLIMQAMQGPSSFWLQAILAGISLGLALLTKATAYLFAPPFLVWLSVALARKLGIKSLMIVFTIFAVALVINLGHYVRTFEVFGSPIGSPSDISRFTIAPKVIDGEFSRVTSGFATSLIRNTASEMGTPSYYGNRIVEVAVKKLEIMLRIEGNDGDFGIVPRQNHEDFAGNPIHLLLIGLSAAALFYAVKRGRASIIHYYVLCLFAGYLVLCFSLPWYKEITRYHLPLLTLWSSAIAIVLQQPVLARARTYIYIMVLLVVTAQYTLFYNESRPLLGPKNIFVVPRLEQYFRNSHPSIFTQYSYTASLLKDRRCDQIGLWLGGGDRWEYPLWILLQDGKTDGFRIEHIRVSNQSSRVSLREGATSFAPCALVLVRINEVTDEIIEGGRVYSKIWYDSPLVGHKVAVYEVARRPQAHLLY
jgi:hypothetical protein